MSGIFLRQGDDFVPMREAPYEAEGLLQALLAEHPEVLAGDESGQDRDRWILIKREAAISDEPGSGGRWSLDHLFLDEDGVPTLVEVKRSSDARLKRREVVAQMLDYAANAAVHWTVDALRAWYESECEKNGEDPDDALVSAFEGVADADGYWQTVQTNLAAGRLRLVFVADEIPSELRRVIEFLNGQMAETEVLGIEVRQYVDAEGERQTIVPKVLGQTEAARHAKRRSDSRRWDRQSLLAELEARAGAEQAGVAERIIDWVAQRDDLQAFYGRGHKDGSFTAGYLQPERLFPFMVYTYGRVEVQFAFMRKRPPFDSLELREELRGRLNAIPGIDIPSDGVERRPSISLATFTDASALEQFITVLEWTFAQADRPAS